MPVDTVVSRGYLAPGVLDGVRGRVRATFDRCAYVTLDDGPALVLHAAGARDHTRTSLCLSSWRAAAVEVGDRVAGRVGHLRIGELVLDVRGARVWRPVAAGPPGSLAYEAVATGQRV